MAAKKNQKSTSKNARPRVDLDLIRANRAAIAAARKDGASRVDVAKQFKTSTHGVWLVEMAYGSRDAHPAGTDWARNRLGLKAIA